MRSSKDRAVRAVFGSAALIFCVWIAVGGSNASARMRIETGQDLYDACSVLAEYHLNPQPPAPAQARYCRQFLAGYFDSLRHLHNDEMLRHVPGAPARDPYACLNIRGPRSYDQLARQIVRTGEWNPKLMDEPAIKLAQKTFADQPPCE